MLLLSKSVSHEPNFVACKKKKFLKNREKNLFDKSLSEIKEFERLKELEKANKV